MDCTICGKSALPGAMLCAPCKAALKRARYVTVQEDIRRTSVIDMRRQPRRARPPMPNAGQAPVTPVPIGGRRKTIDARRRVFGVLAIAVVLGGAGYWGLRELSARPPTDAMGAARSSEGAHQLPVAGAVASQDNQSTVTPLPLPAPANTSAAAPAEIAAQAPATSKASAAPVVKRTVMASRSTFATTNGDPPEAVAPPPEPAKIAAVVAPPPRPVPDQWQTMRDALASCDREGGLGGFICGQKVRVQYCDGYWGKVPQCPGSITTYDR